MKKTTGLIIPCLISSFIFWSLNCWYDDAEVVGHLLVYSGKSFFQGSSWTIFTALFIHADLIHLVGNMVFLYVFGGTLEDELGQTRP